jgi:hypothetical protein
MASLTEDIAYFDEHRAELEADHFGKWVLVHDRAVEGYFDNFQDAAGVAIQRFGRGPYLIRQIGAPAMALPVSVMYGPMTHAQSALRL